MLKVSYVDLKTGNIHITFLRNQMEYLMFIYKNMNLIKVKEVLQVDQNNY